MLKTIDPKSCTLPELYRILSSAVAPRPICMASTIDQEGNVNLSPFSFFNVFSSNPPVMIFSPVKSAREKSYKDTLLNAQEIKEVAINIVNHDMAEQMSLSSTNYEKGINEFVKAGFTELPSSIIKPPCIKESPVSFECTITDIIELSKTPGAGNLIFAKVELIHINEQYLTDGDLDSTKLDLIGRMGESWYVRASGEALFEIPKPIRTKGMGVDQLPIGIRESTILTGNNLGRLGNLERMPNSKEMKSAQEWLKSQNIIPFSEINETEQFHLLAQKLLNEKNSSMALAVLLLGEETNK